MCCGQKARRKTGSCGKLIQRYEVSEGGAPWCGAGGRAPPNTMRALVSRAGSLRAVPLRVPVLALSCPVPRDLVVSSDTSFSPPPLGWTWTDVDGRGWRNAEGLDGWGSEVGAPAWGRCDAALVVVSCASRGATDSLCLGGLGGCDGGVGPPLRGIDTPRRRCR